MSAPRLTLITENSAAEGTGGPVHRTGRAHGKNGLPSAGFADLFKVVQSSRAKDVATKGEEVKGGETKGGEAKEQTSDAPLPSVPTPTDAAIADSPLPGQPRRFARPNLVKISDAYHTSVQTSARVPAPSQPGREEARARTQIRPQTAEPAASPAIRQAKAPPVAAPISTATPEPVFQPAVLPAQTNLAPAQTLPNSHAPLVAASATATPKVHVSTPPASPTAKTDHLVRSPASTKTTPNETKRPTENTPVAAPSTSDTPPSTNTIEDAKVAAVSTAPLKAPPHALVPPASFAPAAAPQAPSPPTADVSEVPAQMDVAPSNAGPSSPSVQTTIVPPANAPTAPTAKPAQPALVHAQTHTPARPALVHAQTHTPARPTLVHAQTQTSARHPSSEPGPVPAAPVATTDAPSMPIVEDTVAPPMNLADAPVADPSTLSTPSTTQVVPPSASQPRAPHPASRLPQTPVATQAAADAPAASPKLPVETPVATPAPIVDVPVAHGAIVVEAPAATASGEKSAPSEAPHTTQPAPSPLATQVPVPAAPNSAAKPTAVAKPPTQQPPTATQATTSPAVATDEGIVASFDPGVPIAAPEIQVEAPVAEPAPAINPPVAKSTQPTVDHPVAKPSLPTAAHPATPHGQTVQAAQAPQVPPQTPHAAPATTHAPVMQVVASDNAPEAAPSPTPSLSSDGKLPQPPRGSAHLPKTPAASTAPAPRAEIPVAETPPPFTSSPSTDASAQPNSPLHPTFAGNSVPATKQPEHASTTVATAQTRVPNNNAKAPIPPTPDIATHTAPPSRQAASPIAPQKGFRSARADQAQGEHAKHTPAAAAVDRSQGQSPAHVPPAATPASAPATPPSVQPAGTPPVAVDVPVVAETKTGSAENTKQPTKKNAPAATPSHTSDRSPLPVAVAATTTGQPTQPIPATPVPAAPPVSPPTTHASAAPAPAPSFGTRRAVFKIHTRTLTDDQPTQSARPDEASPRSAIPGHGEKPARSGKAPVSAEPVATASQPHGPEPQTNDGLAPARVKQVPLDTSIPADEAATASAKDDEATEQTPIGAEAHAVPAPPPPTVKDGPAVAQAPEKQTPEARPSHDYRKDAAKAETAKVETAKVETGARPEPIAADVPRAEAPTPAASPSPLPHPVGNPTQVPQTFTLPDLQAPLPAPAIALMREAAADPGLNVTVNQNMAHVAISSSEGDLSLHVRVRDGSTDVSVGGSMAPLFEHRAPEVRQVLASEGLQLGNFATADGGQRHDSSGAQAHDNPISERNPAPSAAPQTSRTVEQISQGRGNNGHIHVTA